VPANQDLPLTVVDTEQAATQEIFAVLQLVDMGRIQVSAQTRRPSAKGMAAIREVLVGGDFYLSEEREHKWQQENGPIRAFAWPLLLQAAGLASIAGSKLALTAAGRRALGRPAVETLRHAWKKWAGTSIFDEFMWGADELGSLSRYDGLSCVRLTGLGAFCLDLGDSPEPTVAPTVSRVTILPTLDIVADRGRFDPGDETFLSTFCVRRGEGFALDRATALAAIEKGHRASDLARFLEEACGEALPAGAQAFLEDLARRAATLSVKGHALLIECTDPDLASRLGHGTKTKHLCTVVDNRTIVVPAESEAAFRRAVKALGYPVLSRAKGLG